MESIRNDVDDYFDGYSDELAAFDVPSEDPTLGLDKASSRIGTLWRRTGIGAAFARWDSTPDRERTLDAARTDPTALKDESSRLVWEALASIVTKDAFDEVPLVADGDAAARLANELRARLLSDKDGTLAAIVPPWSTGIPLNPVSRKSPDSNRG
jgi:hypothetical protein